MTGTTMTRGYLIIWGWLLLLMMLSLFAGSLALSRPAIVTLMFVVAAVKAVLGLSGAAQSKAAESKPK